MGEPSSCKSSGIEMKIDVKVWKVEKANGTESTSWWILTI